MSLPTGPWTRGDVLDLHIFVLLLVWFVLDRSNTYFRDFLRWFNLAKLYARALLMKTNGGSAGGGR